MEALYIETSVVSYLTSAPSRDLVVAAHQQITHEWWETRRPDYELFVSDIVFEEASRGDVEQARKRVAALSGISLLESNETARSVAHLILESGILPQQAAVDAAHVGVAVANRIDYLLTWNCRHLANARIRGRIEALCRAHGFRPALICTPEELMGD